MLTLTEQGAVATKLINPFPGLRPFHTNEAHLFFGRDGQSEEVLVNLSKNNFAAILGASGTGKSSLIYCGLLPILYGGFLHNGRSKWKVIITHPGSSPINNLAESIAETFAGTDNKEKIETDSLINRALLKRSASGVSNVINQYGIKDDENVLLLIDQFEELFRFQFSSHDVDAANQVDHFVNMISNTVKQTELPIYVVITMRSDFIGECSPYQDLTKLINKSHYLIPRMVREDYQRAITGPVAVGGAKITDQLVQLLLNEMGNNPDELPILQHSLMRTWDYWTTNSDTSQPIGLNEYEAIGRLERALSNHANEAYDELNFEQKHICEIIFKSLTEKGADNRGIRRPTSVAELAQIAETKDEEVIKIVEIFRKKGRTFLTPPPHIPLHSESMVDISHESLMRVWDKLKAWVEDESSAVKMYQRLAESADLFSQGKTSLWGPPDLQLAINWREKQKPNLAWAIRHNPAFEKTMVYLKSSEEEYIAEEENKLRLQKRALRRSRIVALILGSAGMISIGLGILALIQRQDALKSQNLAMEQSTLATQRAKEAEQQKLKADSSAQVAKYQEGVAVQESQKAAQERENALKSAEEARKQKTLAEAQTEIAQNNQKLADENAKKAQEEQRKAEEARLEAERGKMLSISQSMAVKSEQMRNDTLLKGLIAFQAYSFNTEYKGTLYDPDIFKAAYSGLKYFKGSNYNVLQGHTSIVRTIIQDKETVITGGSDGQIISWNLPGKTPTVLLSGLPIVKKMILQGGSLLCLTNESFIKYDLSAKTSETIPLDNPDIKDFYLTKDGKYIIALMSSIVITDDFKNPGTEFYKTTAKVNAIRYDQSSGYLFAALSDGKIYYWKNFQGGSEAPVLLASITDGNWGDINFDVQKNIVAAGTGNNQGAVYLWDIETGKQVNSLRGHTAKITGISFSSDGALMATASYDGSVRLWHINDLNTLPVVFDDHATWVTSIMFTKDDKFVISGDKSGNLRTLPTAIGTVIKDYCSYLSRDLTQAEWQNYVGTDIPYKPTKCNNQ
jgi:WD40 repeat protein